MTTLIEESIRRNDMEMGAEAKTTDEPKAFELVTKKLARCSQTALQLAKRSKKLVSLYTGESEPQEEEDGKDVEVNVDSIVLTHVLRDIENELSQRLLEVDRSLDKLEKAW